MHVHVRVHVRVRVHVHVHVRVRVHVHVHVCVHVHAAACDARRSSHSARQVHWCVAEADVLPLALELAVAEEEEPVEIATSEPLEEGRVE